MNQKETSNLADQELTGQPKNKKSTAVVNALIIGFMIGVVVYSGLNNTVGLFTLIPLFIAYKVFNSSKNSKP